MANHRPDVPYRRTYQNGREVWVARYTNPVTGKREYARPEWNRRRSTFALKRDAQRAISEAIERALKPEQRSDSVGRYAETWLEHRPRSERTNDTHTIRIGRLLDVKLEGKPLREHLLTEVGRRHVNLLVDYMLRVEGRALQGVRGILSSYSAMFNDAIEDELCEVNPFLGVRLRKSDPRIQKPAREPRVWGLEVMHEFAAAAGKYEALVRVLSDCGLRLGEALSLRRDDFDGETLRVRGTAHEGRIIEGDGETKRHCRKVPVPASTAALIQAMPRRIDTDLLFPTPTGKVWRERNFYRDVWNPTREATGHDIMPHDMRHSYVSLLSAEGVYGADLAEVAGHTPATMIGRYTHPVNRSYGQIRKVIG